MIPSSDLLTIASSDDSTIAASSGAIGIGAAYRVPDADERDPQSLAIFAASVLRAAHRFCQPNDDRASQQIKQQANHIARVRKAKSAARLDKEIGASQIAQDGGQS